MRKAAKQDDAGEASKAESDGSAVTPKARSKGSTQTKKRGESSWKYGEIRGAFLASLKEQGYKFADAKAQWDQSKEKKELLSSVTLPELKRRKFVDKTCTVHPWL